METDWQNLPELNHLGPHLLFARLRRGLSQEGLARQSGLSQAQVSLFESGRRLPSLTQFVQMARALDVPLQLLLSGGVRPGVELKDIAVELRLLGAADLWISEANVPGAARRPEEVIALAASGGRPDPRVIETLPALLSWNEIQPPLLRAYGVITRTTYRLAWLTEIALAVDRQKGFPGGCHRAPLERFLKRIRLPPEEFAWDDLGQPLDGTPASPVWRRWRIGYGAVTEDFERRARELASSRETAPGLMGAGAVHAFAASRTLKGIATLPKPTARRKNGATDSGKGRKGDPIER